MHRLQRVPLYAWSLHQKLKYLVYKLRTRRVYKMTSAFVQMCDQNTAWSDKLDAHYRQLMKLVLARWLGVHGDLEGFIGNACYGNWEHLWETDEEKSDTVEEMIESLAGEILYCSDRWTWDRVLRTNWIYLRIKYREMIRSLKAEIDQ